MASAIGVKNEPAMSGQTRHHVGPMQVSRGTTRLTLAWEQSRRESPPPRQEADGNAAGRHPAAIDRTAGPNGGAGSRSGG